MPASRRLDPLFCDQVNRSPSGSGTITSIEGTLNNIGGIETSGVDLNFDLSLGESGAGQFRFQLMASFLFDYDELFANSAGGFDRVDRTGQELGSPTRGFVEEKATLNTFWNLGDFSALLALRYVSALTEQCVGLVADFGETVDLCCRSRTLSCDRHPETNKLDSQLYMDLQFGWTPEDLFGGGWGFAVGVQNLHGRVAARVLLVRPEQPRRHHLPDRGPVLVPPGDIRRIDDCLAFMAQKSPRKGAFLCSPPAASARRRQAANIMSPRPLPRDDGDQIDGGCGPGSEPNPDARGASRACAIAGRAPATW